MAAQPQKSEGGKKPLHESILLFRDRYAQAMEQAVVSEAHTSTPGWQALYAGHRNTIRERRRELEKQIKTLAIAEGDHGLTEDGEKALADLKKDCTQVRSDDSAFERMTVAPVREPVKMCDGIRDEAMNEARRAEEESPLIHVGLMDDMRREIRRVPIPTWNADTGRVEIATPANPPME